MKIISYLIALSRTHLSYWFIYLAILVAAPFLVILLLFVGQAIEYNTNNTQLAVLSMSFLFVAILSFPLLIPNVAITRRSNLICSKRKRLLLISGNQLLSILIFFVIGTLLFGL